MQSCWLSTLERVLQFEYNSFFWSRLKINIDCGLQIHLPECVFAARWVLKARREGPCLVPLLPGAN